MRSYFARNLGAARRPFRFRKNAPFVLHETLPKPVLRKPSERVHAAVLWGENCDCRMCMVFYQDRAVVGLRNALRDLNGGGEAPSNVIEVGNCTEMTTFHNFVLSDWLPHGTGRIISLENFSQFGHTLHEITKWNLGGLRPKLLSGATYRFVRSAVLTSRRILTSDAELSEHSRLPTR